MYMHKTRTVYIIKTGPRETRKSWVSRLNVLIVPHEGAIA